MSLPYIVSDELSPISRASTGTAGEIVLVRPFSPQEKEGRNVHRVGTFHEGKGRGEAERPLQA